MNLAQFQIILQKINALDKNINMDGKISSIEKDLMKAYVSQLYEACVAGEASEPTITTPVAEKEVTPEPTPPVHTPPTPVQQNVVHTTPVQEPTSVQTPIESTQPVVPEQQPVAKIEAVKPAVEQPAAQVENKIKEVNERIATQTKTVADALSKEQGKSINERLADINTKKTFNDKFTDPAKVSAVSSAPVLVNIPDSLKHMDSTNNNHVSQAQPKVNTPPPPPPAPVAKVEQKVTPPPAPVAPVNTPKETPAVNVNAAFSLFESATSPENAGKWGSTPIADLGKSIGLNDKISMIKELFSDDQHAFNNALTQLNNIGGFEQAKDYMMRNLVNVYNWNQGTKSERAQQFINLVRRRYK